MLLAVLHLKLQITSIVVKAGFFAVSDRLQELIVQYVWIKRNPKKIENRDQKSGRQLEIL
jgi:hypothetical protein